MQYLTAARSAAELQAQQVRQEATRLAAVCAGLQEQSSHEREDLAKVAKAAAALETSAGSAEATDATAAALRRRWPELAGELLERCRLSVARLRASTEERVALEAAIAAEHKSSKVCQTPVSATPHQAVHAVLIAALARRLSLGRNDACDSVPPRS